MSERDEIFADWNPWHGCTKISPGCKYCYVYRQDEMYGSEIASSVCRKTAAFDLPVKLKRDRTYKISSGKVVFTCFSSDFRPCNYDWVLDLQKQCIGKDIPFRFHQTGALLIKDGKQYSIPRKFQHIQAHKAGIDYKLDLALPDISEPSLW